jgi:potassium efflux system protein
VGLGFGLQEIFANFVSGIILLLERPVRVGDMVTVGEVTGKVSRIRIRATTITDFDLKELIIPNREFITGQLINWSLSDRKARVVIPVGVAYGSDTELARKTLLDVAAAEPDVLDDPEPTAFFLGFGASSLDFQLRVFIDDTDKLFLLRHRLHMAIDAAFREKGITIAFPQQDVHLFFDDREALDKLAARPNKTT